MRRHLILIVAVVLLGACGTRTVVVANSTPITGPDGHVAWWVECRESVGRCYRMAGKTCPSGYDVWTSDAQTSTVTETHAGVWAPSNNVAFANATTVSSRRYRGTMIIRCHERSAGAVVVQPAPPPSASATAGSGDIARDAPF